MLEGKQHVINFRDLLEQTASERQQIDIDNICKYGIGVLDNYLWWILPSELVVIWADTGCWKSELAYSIAIENAKRWKKILLFSLEWDINEIALRYMQREIAAVKKVKTIDYRFNLKDFKQDELMILEELMDSRAENLMIFKKNEIPTLEFISEMIDTYKDYADMFIIDHINYIEFPSKQNEIEAIWKVMRKLKTITDIIKKPVVLMSHLRKRRKDLDPTEQDLYWSSNIAKEATTIILINKMDLSWNDIAHSKDAKRYSWTKLIASKSRAWLPTVSKFACVYDRWWKCYVDERSHLLNSESEASLDDKIEF